MLILSRKPGEKILIQMPSTMAKMAELLGQTIEVVPVRIRGDAVRIGIHAPGCVNIVREELIEPQKVEVIA